LLSSPAERGNFPAGPAESFPGRGKAPRGVAPARGFLFPVSQPQPGVGGFRYRAGHRTGPSRQRSFWEAGFSIFRWRKPAVSGAVFYKPI